MKVAAVNSWAEPLTMNENLKGIATLLNELEAQQINYALFPELSVSGYLNSPDLLQQYIPKHQATIEQIKNLSQKFNLCFSVGLPMPVNENWGIAQLTFYKGELLHMHFKTHLSVHEKETFVPGDKLQSFQFNEINFGQLLCLESHYPELSLAYQQQNCQVLNFAFASPRETHGEKLERFKLFLRTRAYDNACFVLACNLTGLNPTQKSYAGAALILSPRGEVLAEASGMQPSYAIADIDLNQIDKIKNSTMSNFPAYRNSQISITINQQEQ